MLHAITIHDATELRRRADFLSDGFVGNVLAVWEIGRINHVCVAVNFRLVENMHRDPVIAVGPSVTFRQALVFCVDGIFAVNSFEPAHGEMGASYSLKMRDERVIYDSAANGADDRNSLGPLPWSRRDPR